MIAVLAEKRIAVDFEIDEDKKKHRVFFLQFCKLKIFTMERVLKNYNVKKIILVKSKKNLTSIYGSIISSKNLSLKRLVTEFDHIEVSCYAVLFLFETTHFAAI